MAAGADDDESGGGDNDAVRRPSTLAMTNGGGRTAIALRPKEAAMGMELGAPAHKSKADIAPTTELTLDATSEGCVAPRRGDGMPL